MSIRITDDLAVFLAHKKWIPRIPAILDPPEHLGFVYRIDLKKVILRRLVLGVADGVLEADGNPIYEAKDLRVGLFNAADLA